MPKYTVNANNFVVVAGTRHHNVKCRIARNTGGSYFLNCCGMAGIENLGQSSWFEDWQDKAEVLACLYRELYTNGTVIYAITDIQLKNALHLALLEIGSQQIAEFPNLYHGPRMVHLFKLNIRNAAGRFCNKQGQAYAEPPKDDSEIIPEQTGPGEVNVFARLPT